MRKEQISFGEVAFSSFIPLPKPELCGQLVKKRKI
jgi:hypothetical protein